MLPDIQNLMELQQADREILRLKDEIAALPKRVAAIEEKLAGTKAVLEKAKADVKADEASRRKFETAITDLQGKISKYRDQSLDVKTNEQYKALLHEIQFAEQEIRGNEDKILELMINAENREKSVKAAEKELKEETAEIEKEKAEARQRTAEDEKQLAEWNAKRDTARAAVDADLLRHYDRVAKFRRTGLAEARAQKCMGCQVMLRPQTYNEIRGGNILMCESCQRILYFDPAHEVVAEPADAPHRRRRPRPKADAPQAWFYRAEYGEHGEVLLGFDNLGDNSSRRVYDFNTGRQIGDILIREGKYPLAFPEDLTPETIRLNGSWDEAELESWGTEMPMIALDSLHADLQAARTDAGKSHAAKHEAEAVTSEHPAAS
ncbi:MAG TPA: C4-type zinc ribbon domain-containing protein [Terriglobales bacterium]|jgi:predicted  nucleic acid-binding Zn-ribbon protein|nr:C4-type zinc ribbon domain-containing protein [Terriglobales bacterium]